MIELEGHLAKFGMKSCPIDNSLRIFGQKYALHIIRNLLLLKQSKFGQFLKSIEGINSKTLSIRLRELEDSGLIKRTIIPGRPVHTQYSLTEKGMALEPILSQLVLFSSRYEPKTVFEDGRPRMTINQIFNVHRRAENLSEIYQYS
ncbi:MAG TPA: helix-turn-helix domain-containing protein [Nitrososphaeraceae archaeon]|nr:helix-turn-helix domain-containing protein [Nitrososphaeraceae archaeon]